MVDVVPLDWVLLRREQVVELLASYGLQNARVIGWAGARRNFPGAPVEIAVDRPPATDLTAGDLARIDKALYQLVGLDIVVVVQRAGETDLLPGERVAYL